MILSQCYYLVSHLTLKDILNILFYFIFQAQDNWWCMVPMETFHRRLQAAQRWTSLQTTRRTWRSTSFLASLLSFLSSSFWSSLKWWEEKMQIQMVTHSHQQVIFIYFLDHHLPTFVFHVELSNEGDLPPEIEAQTQPTGNLFESNLR